MPLGKMPNLSDAEVRELAARMKSGDVAARNRLIESVLPLLLVLCNRWNETHVTNNDLFQEASVKLIKNIRHFDPDKGKLTTFLGRNVAWSAKHVRAINRPAGRRLRERDCATVMEDRDDCIDGRILRRKLTDFLSLLTDRQRQIIDLKLNGWTSQQVSGVVGITRQGVQFAFDRVIEKCRERCGVAP